MKINTIKREQKPINQNLCWLGADILPEKPEKARYLRFKSYPVIVDYQYEDGSIDAVLDFCDFDFENKQWKVDKKCKIKQWFPLPSKRKVFRSNKNRTFVRKTS